jgi:bacterial/archaeal transporter family-2 protein
VSKEVAVLATVVAGGAVAFDFAVGLVCILLVTFAFVGGLRTDDSADSVAWYYWVFGGVTGVIIVTTLTTVRELGAGGVTAATIAGQLTLSVVLDRLGVLGLDERAITWEKLLGIAPLAAGTVLIAGD